MCDIDFEKSKVRGGIVSGTGAYAEAVIRRVLYVLSINFAEFTRKHPWWNLLFDKVKLYRSVTSLKTSL